MKTILVTGSNGFIGKNLIERLKKQDNIEIKKYDIESNINTLKSYLKETDFIFHLAGVNRPKKVEEFEIGNINLTKTIVTILEKLNKATPIIFTSSIQASLENPYGISKKKAENILIEYSKKNRAKVYIYRLCNIFGKWCRPNYNSVVATFCHNIARGLSVKISDPTKKIELIYIDDVVSAFINCLDSHSEEWEYREISPSFAITLEDLARQIESFRQSRKTFFVPEIDNPFIKKLYATYLSYLDKNNFAYKLMTFADSRGTLAEFLKQNHFGQLFISHTKPGATRGNHFHHTKAEKFLVVEGDAVIRFRKINGTEINEYRVKGKDFKVVDIPPGYIHSIENLSDGELIVLFWASEIFDFKKPDTYFKKV